MKRAIFFLSVFFILLYLYPINGLAQEPPPSSPETRDIPHGPPIAEKPQIPYAEALGKGRFRIGKITVDSIKKEVLVPGRMNMREEVIEFIASIKGGFKLYESLLEMDANAYEFNLALILVGLDQKKGKASKYHFDPNPPEGDPVEIWLEWTEGGKKKMIRAEDMVFNKSRKTTMPHSPWVYTGSTIMEDGTFMAQMDGVLIGFVHDPAAIIDSTSNFGLTEYGMLVVNKDIVPPVGTSVQLRVKSLKEGN